MATTYTQAKAVLDEIAARMNGDRKKLEQAKTLINQADADLAAIATEYSAFASDLDQLAANNPLDTAIQDAKAQKDRMLTDRNDLKSRSASMKSAVSGL